MKKLNSPSISTLQTPTLWKDLRDAHRYLGEFKGLCQTLPNPNILIECLTMREAKDSSEIENIITTHDDLYASQVCSTPLGIAEKEVQFYAEGLLLGYHKVKSEGICRLRTILEIQATIEKNQAGLRKLPGTVLKNDLTGKVIYEPPQHGEDVARLMTDLVDYIHIEDDLDPLLRMAIAHHHFESIHPFYDGNGRTGRILNILLLIKDGLLDLPIFYLSRYINQTKLDYYRLLQNTREEQDWGAWCEYIIRGVKETAQLEIDFLQKYRVLMKRYKHEIRDQLPKIYSQDLLNRLFSYPYTKIDFLMKELEISRPTATRYLNSLVDAGFLRKRKIGKNHFFINHPLLRLIIEH